MQMYATLDDGVWVTAGYNQPNYMVHGVRNEATCLNELIFHQGRQCIHSAYTLIVQRRRPRPRLSIPDYEEPKEPKEFLMQDYN